MKKHSTILFGILLIATCLSVNAKTVNPVQYGVRNAKNGKEIYEALYRCHNDAIKMCARISYSGIDTLRLEIPKDFKPIPLTSDVDFAGVTIIVDNKQKECSLFTLTEDLQRVDVTGDEIDNGDFSKNKILREGTYLLVIEDQEPWCGRKGYVSKVVRKDAMLIKNGRASNRPIASYRTPASKPIGYYRQTETSKQRIRNLNFIRLEGATDKTYCVDVRNLYNVELNNIVVKTPKDEDKYADKAIHIENCVNVILKDVKILGTYSQERKYGYGISLFNISNLKVIGMYGRGNWGVFGTHCLNSVSLRDCDINRFDIHCYGRDVKAVNCKFSDMYNQFSSVFGEISFEKCLFENEIPVLIESSYNAYTPFELTFKNCTFYLNKEINYLITLFGVPEPINPREELRKKCIPNITIRNCSVLLDDDVNEWFLVKTHGLKYKGEMDYLSLIDIQGMTVNGCDNAMLKLFSEKVPLKRELMVKTKKINTKFEEF